MLQKVVFLELEGITLCGRLYLLDDKIRHTTTVCICHGIPSGKPADPDDGGYPLLAERICHEGFAVFIFNFRGTGDSGGNFDILGWTRDLGVVIDYLCSLPEVDESRLTLLGFSGGAAVSIYVAAQDGRVSGVAACACPAEFIFLNEVDEKRSAVGHYRNIGAIRDAGFPQSDEDWFGGFSVIRPIEYVAGIAPRPLLLVHGNEDETVDVSHACRLCDRAGEPKQMVIVDGAGHRLRQNDEAMAAVIEWLKSQFRKC